MIYYILGGVLDTPQRSTLICPHSGIGSMTLFHFVHYSCSMDTSRELANDANIVVERSFY